MYSTFARPFAVILQQTLQNTKFVYFTMFLALFIFYYNSNNLSIAIIVYGRIAYFLRCCLKDFFRAICFVCNFFVNVFDIRAKDSI